MDEPRLYGSDYSVYVRIVRLCLLEKGVDHHLLPVDVFAPGGPPEDHFLRHPFGRIPAFEHGEFSLYETGAISRYVDEAFEGPPLQPSDSIGRARCNQLISIADNYVYPDLVWGIYVERVSKPEQGIATDHDKVEAAVASGRRCLAAIDALMRDGPWLVGQGPTLADLYLAPMMDYLLMTAEGRELIRPHAALEQWWSRMASRPSMTATAPG